MSQKVVLAFSGGLDTSYCVLALKKAGYEVITYFVDTAGPGSAEASPEEVAARAKELGAVDHHNIEASQRLWDGIVVPLIQAGEWRQGRYPLLCADRYLIVEAGIELAKSVGAGAIAHGCTGMGNDQVRFDRSARALSDLEVLAPIRDIPASVGNVRDYERGVLEDAGFAVPASQKRYTINQNLLGTTFSGGEIDEWKKPDEAARSLTAAPADWPRSAHSAVIAFDQGKAISLNGQVLSGPELLSRLNHDFGAYGVGFGTYTGDTLPGLKGRIAFEAPGLVVLEAAHRALEHAVLTAEQNAFKPVAAAKWADLVYDGGYFDPLRAEIEAFISATQARVHGAVTVETHGGRVDAVEVDSPMILKSDTAVYAQRAGWSGEEAQGFTKLSGQSSALWSEVGRKVTS